MRIRMYAAAKQPLRKAEIRSTYRPTVSPQSFRCACAARSWAELPVLYLGLLRMEVAVE
jgi:hypothetical protein